ncbi:MAG: DEAD/DEAH box helicase [Deltaproteobacteria bacterium]|nr:DEAD/DEAH box helicase [Deltaproteobacteria bacterium]
MKIPFHPLVWRWFAERFSAPTPAQEMGWREIAQGKAALISAPTGSGKTLAAFLWSIDRVVRRGLEGKLPDETQVVYVSPLKALGNDIEKNLKDPLAGIRKLAEAEGLSLPPIRIAVRSGDTPARERASMVRRPPHILITTPESLYILLTAERSREFLRRAHTVIVDEIHAVAGNKRGAHLALSLERLEALAERRLQRIGLSATQKPIEEVARLLVGAGGLLPGGHPDCAIVDFGHRRSLDLSIGLPEMELGPITRQEIWAEIYDRIAGHVKEHRTTLVFVNTRRLVERVSHQLSSRIGEGKVGAHHGSLSRTTRLEVEERLKSGALPVVVATASLELGIDIGHVDLVCHIGSPRTLAILLQRVGRSGHALGTIPRGILYPLTRDDLLQCMAAIRAVRNGELDALSVPEKPLDVLAQQIVATAASLTPRSKRQLSLFGEATAGIREEELFSLIRRAYPYRNLTAAEYEAILEMLSEGIAARRGRRGAYLHRDLVHRRIRARRGARLIAVTNGGAIPDTADYDVIETPADTFIGKVNEDFAIESLAGDIFLLGNRSWRIRRVSPGKVWVEDAQGLPPSIPFWLGEAPARTWELSVAVCELRNEIESRLDDSSGAAAWLANETGCPPEGAGQVIAYLRDTRAVLGCVPTMETLVAERFFDEAGGMQLVLHSPFGGRINRAWGLALRKRFCVSFDRELQAAATDDGVVISLAEQHSFPLKDVFSFVSSSRVEKDLVQAALASPMFTNRWRWNATRALAVVRQSGGKKVPMAIQRIRAEELLAAVFPEQVMCQDNRSGPVELPDHPLVNETMKDCLHEAMDLEGLKAVVKKIEHGSVRMIAVDTPAPSLMAHEILNANPYAFLDDAPLEERRARAVSLRRIDPELSLGVGALSPQAIEKVRSQAKPDIRDADELHDFLLSVGLLPAEDAEWSTLAEELIRAGRATVMGYRSAAGGEERRAYVAAERLHWARAIFREPVFEPQVTFALDQKSAGVTEEEAMRYVLQGWLEISGPTTAAHLARTLGLVEAQVERALVSLEASGLVLRGRFTPGQTHEQGVEWCERALLARIHRLTLGQLRREIEPVSPADFIRFLLVWQHVRPSARLRGREGILEVIGQLQGLELPATAWEEQVLPSRMAEYDPAHLEEICLGGVVAWGRLRPDSGVGAEEETVSGAQPKAQRTKFPSRVAPIAFVLRENLDYFLDAERRTWEKLPDLSTAARDVARYLAERGASFLTEIARATGLLNSQAEEALWELVARGVVTGDGIAGLRVLLTPDIKRRGKGRRLRLISGRRGPERLLPLGRWSLWRQEGPREAAVKPEIATEFSARQLLQRYGIVMRELLARETRLPRWRLLTEVYRRLEARGEIRGGRFVGGFAGEQYALPQAVDKLRQVRRSAPDSVPVIVFSADPLNLVGILAPGGRVSPYSNQVIAYKDGVPVDVGQLGEVLSRQQPRIGVNTDF